MASMAKHTKNDRTLCVVKMGAAALAGMILSGCVSDTLSQQNTQPQPLAEQQTPSYDPAQREQAIAEIRAKADNSGSGELTNAFAEANGPNEPLTPQEQAAKIAELQGNANTNNSSISDAELAAKQKSINDLRNQAKTHYNNAVNTIKK